MGICRICGLESAILEGGSCLSCLASDETGPKRCGACGCSLADAVRVACGEDTAAPRGLCDTCNYIEEEERESRRSRMYGIAEEGPVPQEIVEAKLDGYCPWCGRRGDFAEAGRCPCGFAY